MAVKTVIVLLINAVISNELGSANVVEVPAIIAKNPSLESQHAEVNSAFNNQVLSQAPETNYDNVIELQKEESTPCYSTAVLIPILNQLLNILMQDPSYENRVTRISALLKEYLNNMIQNENKGVVKLNDDGQNGGSKDVLRTGFNEPIAKGHVKTKVVFKYDLPSINQPRCKDAFMRLIKSAYDAYIQLAKNPMCQHAGFQDSSNNLVPNINDLNNKQGYNLYNLLAPNHPELNTHPNNVLHEPNKYIYDLNNAYGNYKPIYTDDQHQGPKNIDNYEPHTNIFEDLIYNKQRPNIYDVNGYVKNPNSPTTYDTNYYRPHSNIPENYDSNHNIYNILDNNNRKEPVVKKYDSGIFPQTNNGNFNLDDLKIPGNNWKVPLNVLIGNINEQSHKPLDSVLSLLPTPNTPAENMKLEDKAPQLNYDKTPYDYQHNQNDMPFNPNIYQANVPSEKINELTFQYQTPMNDYVNHIQNNLDYKVSPQHKSILSQYNQPFYKYVSNEYGTPYNKISMSKPYQQNVNSNYLHNLGVLPNLQQIHGVPNDFKLDPSVNAGVIELTFVLKRATPLIYQPLYFVKFRIPYTTYLRNVQNLLLRKPHLKINPLKLYQELIALSNVSDISPSLKGYKKEDILRLAYKNGELVTAKLLKDDDALNDQLKLVQNLNSGIGAADIWKLATKNNGLIKNTDKGNSSEIFNEIGRHGNVISPYYDLTSSGIGFNSQPIAHYEQRPVTVSGTIRPAGTSLGIKLMQPRQYSSVVSQKSIYSPRSLGLHG